jgi:hypothetical protein
MEEQQFLILPELLRNFEHGPFQIVISLKHRDTFQTISTYDR